MTQLKCIKSTYRKSTASNLCGDMASRLCDYSPKSVVEWGDCCPACPTA